MKKIAFLKQNYSLYSNILRKYSTEKLLFYFSVTYFVLFSLLIHIIFSNDPNFLGNDSLLFHNIALQLCHFVETGHFDFSIIQEGRDSLIAYCNTTDTDFLFINYIFQFPAVIAAVLYHIFQIKQPLLINFTNILIHSLATTILYLFFFKTSKSRTSSLLAVTIVGFFPSNIFTVMAISKGVYYYLGFSIFCIGLTTRRKYLFLLSSIAILMLTRPYYFINYQTLQSFSFSNVELSWSALTYSIYCKIDFIARAIANVRKDPVVLACTSNFDFSTLPLRGDDLIEYIPTGFIVGLFKPYPSEWFNFSKGILFLMASIETLFVYVGLFLCPFTLFHRKSLNLWMISLICLLTITAYGTISYNLGYLYRARFIFIGVLAGMGFMYFPILLDLIKLKLSALPFYSKSQACSNSSIAFPENILEKEDSHKNTNNKINLNNFNENDPNENRHKKRTFPN